MKKMFMVGIIQYSVNPYSSLVLLVRKKIKDEGFILIIGC